MNPMIATATTHISRMPRPPRVIDDGPEVSSDDEAVSKSGRRSGKNSPDGPPTSGAGAATVGVNSMALGSEMRTF